MISNVLSIGLHVTLDNKHSQYTMTFYIIKMIYQLYKLILNNVLDHFCIVGTDLLEVGSETVHILVIGQHGLGLSVEKVDVPNAQQSQQDGSVLIQGSSTEVLVLYMKG